MDNGKKCFQTSKVLLSSSNPWTHKSSVESIYEINIQEQNSFSSKTNSLLSDHEKLAIANVFPVALEKDSKDSSIFSREKFRIFANPFIESYYPVLNDPSSPKNTDSSFISLADDYFSEEDNYLLKKNYSFDTKNSKHEDSNLSNLNENKNVKSIIEERQDVGKSSESSIVQTCPSVDENHNKKNLKREIIQSKSFSIKNGKKLASFMKEISEKEQWHLHHHEHHHYYYVNHSISKNNSYASDFTNLSDDEPQLNKNVKVQITTNKLNKSFADGHELSEMSGTSDSSGIEANKKNVKTFQRNRTKRMEPVLRNASTNVDFKSLAACKKKSSSTDSLSISRRSDSIFFHTLSDSNISRQTSETTLSQPMTYLIFKPKDPNEKETVTVSENENVDEDTPCELCDVKHVKHVNHFLDSTWKSKKREVPQKFHIKYSHPIIEKSKIKLDDPFLAPNNSGKKVKCLEEKATGQKSRCQSNDWLNSTSFEMKNSKFNHSNLTMFKPKKYDQFEKIEDESRKMLPKSKTIHQKIDMSMLLSDSTAFNGHKQSNETLEESESVTSKNATKTETQNINFWTQQFKYELEEIKNQLCRIEERHEKKKENFFIDIPGRKNVTTNDFFGAEITVYSSKTYILGGDSFSSVKEQNVPYIDSENVTTSYESRIFESNSSKTYHLYYSSCLER